MDPPRAPLERALRAKLHCTVRYLGSWGQDAALRILIDELRSKSNELPHGCQLAPPVVS